MITLFRSIIETEEVKKIIDKKLEHHYLDSYIQKPKVSEEKLAFLTHIINNTNLSKVKKTQYIVTTMLVQVALDIHDTVPISSDAEESDVEKTTKQLTVLAGDYYSGLYYLLLSETEDINMISNLATAIREINELKMQLYYKDISSFNHFIYVIEQIDSLLIKSVAEHVNQPIMGNVASKFIFTHKLIEERDLFLQSGSSRIVKGWLSISPKIDDQTIVSLIEDTIQKNIDKVEDAISNYALPFAVFQPYINHIKDKLVVGKTSFVEEG